MKKFIVSIDQGTTSTRSILFDIYGNQVFVSQKEIKQYFPKNGWVEHDPDEIWKKTKLTLIDAIKKSLKLKGKILTIGITNQRETTLIWDKATGKCIYNAIVWQDRRTYNFCSKLKKKGLERIIKYKTGLLLDPYFSSSKIHWILKNIPSAKRLIKKNRLLFGTIDTFLIWKLTKGKVHATDATNASRTMLYDIKKNKWDNKLLKIFEVPHQILPSVKNSADNFGFTDKSVTQKSYSITGVIGDQQAAIIGQGCFSRGSTKITYGTGAFVIMNTGNEQIISKNKLITTICYRLNNKTTYALEGSIFIAGAGVQWLRDKIKLIKNVSEIEKILKLKNNREKVYFVPAFTGLGAPYWRPDARGLITGLTRNSDWKSLIKATIESVVYQTSDLFESMTRDSLRPSSVKIDGGMASNNWFTQFLSNILKIKITRSKINETTALGAAYIAGYQIGIFKSLEHIKKKWKKDRDFMPKFNKSQRNKLLQGWKQAIRKTLT
ncbi:MAG: glycerol kinase GlpK [Candidatus Pelagibacter sp.]